MTASSTSTASITSTASTGSTASVASASTAVEPMSLKIPITGVVVFLLQGLMALSARGSTTFRFTVPSDFFQFEDSTLNARLIILIAAGIVAAVTAVALVRAMHRREGAAWVSVLMGVGFVVAFLAWAGAGRNGVIPLVTILSSALGLSVPLVYGSLAGIIGERSGTINIAIEGQLLGGAFLGAVVASAWSNPWVGLLAAPVAGVLVALLLALFGLRYRVNQIVVGVVLNVLVSGLTGFLFSTFLSSSPSLNRALRLPTLAVPILSRVPIIGPVLFRQTILVYLMYVAVAVLSAMLFRSRWGLRLRACGEHPKAADTVGIKVMRTRVANLALAGALAGLGGAFFTVGSGLSFDNDMTAGNGYIALAAMILGAWRPLGSLGAALLFGFATSVAQTLPIIGSSVSPDIISMIPYIVTILAVAGFVGKVRAPAAEGVPYP